MSSQVGCYLSDSRSTKRLGTRATQKSGKANGKLRGAGNDAQKENVARESGRRRGLPNVMELEERFPCYNAVHKMGAEVGDPVVLVNPSEVVGAMKDVPQGKSSPFSKYVRTSPKHTGPKRAVFAYEGIFIMTAANAAEEAAQEGTNMNIPYWRTLKADGS